MATAKTRTRKARRWPSFLLAAFVVGAGVYWAYGDIIGGYAQAGTTYGAKNACSCRYVGGRELGSCKTDFIPGMSLVFLTEDEEEQSVSATIPLIASNTARFHEGFGCMLDPWEG